MCKNYGNDNFKKYTKYQFNITFRDGKIKNNLMSFYSWLIRISKDNSIDISKDLLAKLWNRKQSKKASKVGEVYKKVSATTVLRWLHKLEKAKLLYVDRSNKNNKYILNQDGSINPNIFLNSKKCTDKCTDKKVTQTVVNAAYEELAAVYKNKKLNSNNKDIDILYNSCEEHSTVKTLNYKSFLAKEKKVSSIDEMLTIINKMCKIMRVRSAKIKNSVICSVMNYWHTVTKVKADKYVAKAIQNAREKYYSDRTKNFFNSCNKHKYNTGDSFNNYQQRDYDFDELERKLLGWE